MVESIRACPYIWGICQAFVASCVPNGGAFIMKGLPRRREFFLVEFTCNILYHFEKGKSLSNYNCMKLVAPSPLSICSFPKWYWARIDGHAWNGLSKPLKFCRKFTVSIGILQINYCPAKSRGGILLVTRAYICPRRDFARKAKSRGGTLVTRAYVKESTYSWNI